MEEVSERSEANEGREARSLAVGNEEKRGC